MAYQLETKLDNIVNICQNLKSELKTYWFDETVSPGVWTDSDGYAQETYNNLDYIEVDINTSFKSNAVTILQDYESEIDIRHPIRLAALKLKICFSNDFLEKFVAKYLDIREGTLFDDVLHSSAPLGKLNEIDALDLSVESNLSTAKTLSEEAVTLYDDDKGVVSNWNDVHQTAKSREDTFLDKFNPISQIFTSEQHNKDASKDLYNTTGRSQIIDIVESVQTKLDNEVITESEVAAEIASEINTTFLNDCTTINNKIGNL